jgi:hypothetical protein
MINSKVHNFPGDDLLQLKDCLYNRVPRVESIPQTGEPGVGLDVGMKDGHHEVRLDWERREKSRESYLDTMSASHDSSIVDGDHSTGIAENNPENITVGGTSAPQDLKEGSVEVRQVLQEFPLVRETTDPRFVIHSRLPYSSINRDRVNAQDIVRANALFRQGVAEIE